MNMKDFVSDQSRLLLSEQFEGNELALVTAAGIIFGTPLFHTERHKSHKEEIVLEKMGMLLDSTPGTLICNEFVFILRDVRIRNGMDIATFPFLFVRFDSVLACAVGKF